MTRVYEQMTKAFSCRFGSTLIASGEIAPGTVFTVLFSVMTGSFALGGAGPSIAVIATAKGSAYSIFEIIDRVSFYLILL